MERETNRKTETMCLTHTHTRESALARCRVCRVIRSRLLTEGPKTTISMVSMTEAFRRNLPLAWRSQDERRRKRHVSRRRGGHRVRSMRSRGRMRHFGKGLLHVSCLHVCCVSTRRRPVKHAGCEHTKGWEGLGGLAQCSCCAEAPACSCRRGVSSGPTFAFQVVVGITETPASVALTRKS